MSASTYRESVINCDAPDCVQTAFASHLELPHRHTAADVRRVLRRRGWTTGVAIYDGIRQKRRLDFCPAHKPPAGAK